MTHFGAVCVYVLCASAYIYIPYYMYPKSAMHTGELPNWQFHYYVPYAPQQPLPPSAVIGLKMGRSMVYIKGFLWKLQCSTSIFKSPKWYIIQKNFNLGKQISWFDAVINLFFPKKRTSNNFERLAHFCLICYVYVCMFCFGDVTECWKKFFLQ